MSSRPSDGKASGLVHGYETILRDVHRAKYNGETTVIDFKGQVWDPNDCAAVLIHNLIDGLRAVQSVLGQPNTADRFDDRWSAQQKRLGMLLSDEEMRTLVAATRSKS